MDPMGYSYIMLYHVISLTKHSEPLQPLHGQQLFRALAKGSPIERRSPRIAHLRLPQHLLIVAGRRHPPDFWGNHGNPATAKALDENIARYVPNWSLTWRKWGFFWDFRIRFGCGYGNGNAIHCWVLKSPVFGTEGWSWRYPSMRRLGVQFLPDSICTVVEAGAS